MSPEVSYTPEPDQVLDDAQSEAFHYFARFADLTEEKREIAARMKDVESEMQKLTPRLLAYFERNTVKAVSVKGTTVFARRELWARSKTPGDRARVCLALQAAGMGHFVHPDYNAQTLSKWARDLEREYAEEIADGKELADFLPPALAEVLNVTPNWKVVGVRSRRF